MNHVFWTLAFLPGVIALSHLFFGVLPRRSRRRREIVPFVNLAAAKTQTPTDAEDEKLGEEIEGLASPAAIVFGAFVLVAIFGIAAALSVPPPRESATRERRPLRIGLELAATSVPTTATNTPMPSATATSSPTPTPTPTAAAPTGKSDPSKADRGKTPLTEAAVAARLPGQTAAAATTSSIGGASTDSSDPIDRSGGVSEGVVGLVFATYGAYVYTMILLIVRVNSNGVTGKFLFNSAIRSAISMIFGYAIGVFGLFAAATNAKTGLFLYFAVGVFPSWAFDAFRKRAKELFQQKETGCDVLPLCLIDGVDDGIIDRLAEVGVWDIQHLASADAPDLVMRTLFPLHRVLDWIDQAVLIKYIKNDIAEFRRQGIRSAIELLAVYGDATGQMSQCGEDPQKRLARAENILTILSQKTSFSKDSLYAIGRSLFEDVPLNRIWAYWQYVQKGAAVSVSPVTLQNGVVGTPYNQWITASGGTPPHTFTTSSGTLPTGVSLSSIGVLSGTPSEAKKFTFTVKATDACGNAGCQTYTVMIA